MYNAIIPLQFSFYSTKRMFIIFSNVMDSIYLIIFNSITLFYPMRTIIVCKIFVLFMYKYLKTICHKCQDQALHQLTNIFSFYFGLTSTINIAKRQFPSRLIIYLSLSSQWSTFTILHKNILPRHLTSCRWHHDLPHCQAPLSNKWHKTYRQAEENLIKRTIYSPPVNIKFGRKLSPGLNSSGGT